MPGQAQLVAQCHQVGEAVSRADQREGDVIAAQLIDHDARGPHHDVDSVLRAHDTDVRGEETAAPAQLGTGLAAPQMLWIRARADHRDISGRLTAARNGDVPVGVVGGDHMVRGPVRPALQRPQAPVRQPGAARETRLEELRGQVMMIENEPGAINGPQGQRDRPEDVGRIAGLHRREPSRSSCPECQPGGPEERVGVLSDEAELAAARRVGPVLVQLYTVDDLIGGVALALGAHDRDLIAVGDERLALQPHAPVEGHRQVLDDNEDAGHQPIPS